MKVNLKKIIFGNFSFVSFDLKMALTPKGLVGKFSFSSYPTKYDNVHMEAADKSNLTDKMRLHVRVREKMQLSVFIT